jgi:D-glycero-alpha-D-manno-heptose-7-phosphate kinase
VSAPVRANDIGGWTDTWFAGWGRVLNLAVRPGVAVEIDSFTGSAGGGRSIRVVLENFGGSFSFDPGKPDFRRHPLIQAVISSIPIPEQIRLVIRVRSAVPPASSLGTSAAVAVALLKGLLRLAGRSESGRELAARAHGIETETLGWQSGIQDQISAALGGICLIDMPRYPAAGVQRIRLDPGTRRGLQERLRLVYLGKGHVSSDLHQAVIERLAQGGPGRDWLERLRGLPEVARTSLAAGDLEGYGEVMIQNHECQRGLYPALISRIADEVAALAGKTGAAGWKVNGAGGQGGSMTLLLSSDPGRREAFDRAAGRLGRGIRILPFSLSFQGVKTSGKGPSAVPGGSGLIDC